VSTEHIYQTRMHNTHTDYPPEHQMSPASSQVAGCCSEQPRPVVTVRHCSHWKWKQLPEKRESWSMKTYTVVSAVWLFAILVGGDKYVTGKNCASAERGVYEKLESYGKTFHRNSQVVYMYTTTGCSTMTWSHQTERCRFQWPSSVRWGSAATCLLGLRVWIPPGAWMFVLFVLYSKDTSQKTGQSGQKSTDKVRKKTKGCYLLFPHTGWHYPLRYFTLLAWQRKLCKWTKNHFIS
jgi:hypothetical protein